MTDIEAATRKLAAELDAPQGPNAIDGEDQVRLDAGWVARCCADAADLGGQLAEMTFALTEAMEGWADPAQQRFAGALAKLCAEIAKRHPDSPGDSIRDAFLWTGWCHSTLHGEAVRFQARLQGPGTPAEPQRTRLENAFAAALLHRLVTCDAVHAACHGDNHWPNRSSAGSRAYWTRRWKTVRAEAIAEAFPDGLPPQTSLRLRFSYSPW